MTRSANVLFNIRFLCIILLTPYLYASTQLHSLTIVLSVCNVSTTVSPYNLTTVLKSNTHHDNLPDMFDVCSHGIKTYQTTIVPYVINIPCIRKEMIGDVYRKQQNMSCDYWRWSSSALELLKQTSPTLYYQHYDHIIFVLPEFMQCNFAGMGVIGPCSGYECRIWIVNIYATQLATYIHEIGHTMGLLHAGNNKSGEYGDLSSAMGECCYQRCYNAANTNFLNWTHPKYSFNILPFRSFSKDMLLQSNEYIQIVTPYDAKYFIQYRYPISTRYDNEIMSNFSKCINIYHTTFDKPSQTNLMNILCSTMSSWSDSKEHFTITIKMRVNETTVINLKTIDREGSGSQTCTNML